MKALNRGIEKVFTKRGTKTELTTTTDGMVK